VSLYANRSEALVQGAAAPAVSGGFNVVNVGEILPPYLSTQYEVGGKLTLDRVTASLSFFITERATAILVPVPGPPANDARFEASGRQRNRGIELSIQAEPVHSRHRGRLRHRREAAPPNERPLRGKKGRWRSGVSDQRQCRMGFALHKRADANRSRRPDRRAASQQRQHIDVARLGALRPRCTLCRLGE
jgi:hypothetical protein